MTEYLGPEKWSWLPTQTNHRIPFYEQRGRCVGKESREAGN